MGMFPNGNMGTFPKVPPLHGRKVNFKVKSGNMGNVPYYPILPFAFMIIT
jgi:hypothetical protein